ncbi:MAG: alpha/beta hydrolase [Rhodospirillales bacterium]|nr:alpha/beta hydrolase [Rhodospirillales bacterium]
MRRGQRSIGTILLALTVVACAPRIDRPGPVVTMPVLEDTQMVTNDGAVAPLHRWLPETDKVRAAVIALHGFNDYGNFFAEPGIYLARLGIAAYAFDQRGFGGASGRGIWPGVKAYADDLKTMTDLVRARHPGMPLYLLGASMGGAVIMVAMTGDDPPPVDGIILAAPAVWGRTTMPFYQRWALAIAAHTVPWLTVTGRGLKIRASDNIEMLRALSRDPLVIKETRIDTIYGLSNLMDRALAAAPALSSRALILYGKNDEVIPEDPVRRMIESLPAAGRQQRRLAYYDNGFHMLLRDLQGETVWRDIVAWIEDAEAPLPSGADARFAP